MPDIDRKKIAASVAYYLEELALSGIEGLCRDTELQEHCDVASAIDRFAKHLPTNGNESGRKETVAMLRHALGECQRCGLSATRKNIVFGSGNPKPQILFVGEAPGAEEDKQGEPFVGEAGALLTRIITGMGLKREGVYICNLIKCRPPNNRDPKDEEVDACSPYLHRQIKALSPEIIITLGKFATQHLIKRHDSISHLRGRFYDYAGIPLMPTFHPSYLLHHKDNKELFWMVWDDMVQVLRRLSLPVPEKRRKN